MARPLLLFSKYASIGVLNTLLHWFTFYMLVWAAGCGQALANLLAFIVAVTFSFFMNARYTFKAKASRTRYLCFVLFMAGLSFATGWIGDHYVLPPLVTLIVFSLISLVVGFFYSRYVVFREKADK